MFNPVLGKNLKLSAEDIEIGLVKPDASLAHLHIELLKVLYCPWVVESSIFVCGKEKHFFSRILLIDVWMHEIDSGSNREVLYKCRNVAILVIFVFLD